MIQIDNNKQKPTRLNLRFVSIISYSPLPEPLPLLRFDGVGEDGGSEGVLRCGGGNKLASLVGASGLTFGLFACSGFLSAAGGGGFGWLAATAVDAVGNCWMLTESALYACTFTGVSLISDADVAKMG